MLEPHVRVQNLLESPFGAARQRAQGLIEYGLIIALVAVLAIAGLIIFGPALSSLATRLGGGG
jgi:Flp pilus assembly pilin Flp